MSGYQKLSPLGGHYSFSCDESYGTRNVKVSWQISTDESNQVSSINKLNNGLRTHSAKLLEKIKLFFYQAFLPQGFPESVSDDYIEYQVWDTTQAFCSTLTSVLTTQAIMQGMGVGNEAASTLAAATAWIIKDYSGMVGRILFAWWGGSIMDSDCKRWRIIADIINDCAMFVELLLPWFGQHYVVYLLALSSLGKSLVGVAGGATRASITQHQARTDNVGDIAAKDGSQETCVNLTASLIGLTVLKLTTDNVILTWIFFFILTGLHIYSNYRAVCCLQFNSLNRQRFLILFKHYLHSKEILSPSQVRLQERILFPLSEKEVFNLNITLGASMSVFQASDSVCIAKYKDWCVICYQKSHGRSLKCKPGDMRRVEDLSVVLRINSDVKHILKSYCFAVFYNIKKNLSPSVSRFQKELKYENDEEEFKHNYFEDFYYKLQGSQQWDLSHLNHFQINEWRYHNLTIDKEKIN
uniref:RUS1 family protein C16orf58 homolog n=1 Tax=Cacopsylla melanoneura TaxID=428564 RepID=A0A8D8V4W0_9HEMI